MELGSLKPLLTTVLLPPLSLLLLALLGLLLIGKKPRRAALGKALATVSVALLWVVSCHGTSVWLSSVLLPAYPPLKAATLKTANVQAIVVLGGGLVPNSPEYGQPQPSGYTTARLRYGISLSRQSGLPIAFSGGHGWASVAQPQAVPHTEADVAARVALQDYGVALRWLERQSRDTSENARLTAALLGRDGVTRIALVTDAWHMPRAQVAFERSGLRVTPAPMGFIQPAQPGLLTWLPSTAGLSTSQLVLREWLGLLAARWLGP